MTYFTFLLAIGMAFFIFFLMAKNIYRFYLAGDYWKETKGVILEVKAELEGYSSSNTHGHKTHDSYYIPKPKYEYWVGSESFTGETYQTGMVSTFETEDEVLSLFTIGQEVVVFYNPDNPKEAILSKDQEKGSIVTFGIMGIILLGIAFFIGRKLY